MTGAAMPHPSRAAGQARLGSRIALVLLVKIAGLAVIWFLFVRDQRVVADARTTAAAFGLAASQPDTKSPSEGKPHGQ